MHFFKFVIAHKKAFAVPFALCIFTLKVKTALFDAQEKRF